MPTLNDALSYLERGFSIIPIGPDKTPLIKWAPFQQRRPTIEEVTQWFHDNPNANLAVITGAISGIVVVDIEKGGSTEGLPPTVTVKTQGDGWHYYYKHPGKKVTNAVRFRELADIRGDGGYAVLPPSVGKKGKYEWLISPDEADFADLPEEILKVSIDDEKPPVDWAALSTGAELGNRNQSATQLIGKILAGTPMTLWKSVVWPGVVAWNNSLKPPMTTRELQTIWDSITTRETKGRPEERQQIDKDTPQMLLEMWDNFTVTGGARKNDFVVLDTTAGKLRIPMEDLYNQTYFLTKVFSSFGIVLETKKKAVWMKWLSEITKTFTLLDAADDDTFKEAIKETLDSFVNECEEDDISFVSKNIPVYFEDGIAFKLKHFLDVLSVQKGVSLSRNEILLILKNDYNVETKRQKHEGKDYHFYFYRPTNE